MNIYPPGTRLADRYEVASRPMTGGMGVVYFCIDTLDNKPVALKTFRPEYLDSNTIREHFLEEGTNWINIGYHPNIVHCYTVDYSDPITFLSLELISKEQDMPDASLRSYLTPNVALPMDRALIFALQIARGMQHAAQRVPGFVHRDLKPENILVGEDKLTGTDINRLRVTDFGLSKAIVDIGISSTTFYSSESELNHIQFTRGAGTPLYMAPEQWKGQNVGVFTDIYAFGCILFEMVTGQRAADGKTIRELEELHCIGKLQTMPASLPQEISSLLTKSLMLNPIHRFAGWNEIINELDHAYAVQNGQPAPNESVSADLDRKDRAQKGWAYNAIGMSYSGLGNIRLATYYFERALAVGRAESDRYLSSVALGNLGRESILLGDPQRGIEYIEQRLAVARDMGLRRGEANALTSLGVAYKDQGDSQRATENHEQALAIFREISDKRGEASALGNFSKSQK